MDKVNTEKSDATTPQREMKVGGQTIYTVEEIVAVFRRIDGQLLDLHRCSSDDFLGLNAQFKGFYKETKGMSTSAGALFLLLSEGANHKLITALTEFHEKIAQSEVELMRQLNSSIDAVLKIRMTLEGVYLPLRNATQNVEMLRLLLANLNLSLEPMVDKASGAAEKGNAPVVKPRIEESVTKAHQAQVARHIAEVNKVSGVVRGFSKWMEEVRARLEEVRQESSQGVESVINAVHHGLRLFEEKQEEAHVRIPEITSKSENCSKSIAGIITNLQYQDIIRQKMEHIQTAHQTLMEDLGEMDPPQTHTNSEGELDEYWVRMLVQVRDIAALQSAQLVNTNREYQQAIETIGRHFREIAVEMEEIATLCRTALQASSESGSSSTSISHLLSRLQRSRKVLGDLSLSLPRFWRDLERVSERTNEVVHQLAFGHQSYQLVEEHLRALVLRLDKVGSTDLKQQLVNVLDDLRGFWNVVDSHREELQQQREALENHEDSLKGASPLWDDFRKGAEHMHNIGMSLAQTEQESSTLLAKIELMSKKVSEDTRVAMQSIRYYDFFEKVIGELVNDLNTMSMRIREEIKDSDVLSDMSEVRRLYTMASERKIHDEVLGSGGVVVEEGDVDLFGGGIIDDASVAQDEDDDGLELF